MSTHHFLLTRGFGSGCIMCNKVLPLLILGWDLGGGGGTRMLLSIEVLGCSRSIEHRAGPQ